MSLSDLIQAEKKLPGAECTVAKILKALDPADAATLTAALVDVSVASNQLARALNRAGHMIGRETIQRHRRGDCSCGTR